MNYIKYKWDRRKKKREVSREKKEGEVGETRRRTDSEKNWATVHIEPDLTQRKACWVWEYITEVKLIQIYRYLQLFLFSFLPLPLWFCFSLKDCFVLYNFFEFLFQRLQNVCSFYWGNWNLICDFLMVALWW